MKAPQALVKANPEWQYADGEDINLKKRMFFFIDLLRVEPVASSKESNCNSEISHRSHKASGHVSNEEVPEFCATKGGYQAVEQGNRHLLTGSSIENVAWIQQQKKCKSDSEKSERSHR